VSPIDSTELIRRPKITPEQRSAHRFGRVMVQTVPSETVVIA